MCSVDVDECSTVICSPGKTCQNSIGSYTCVVKQPGSVITPPITCATPATGHYPVTPQSSVKFGPTQKTEHPATGNSSPVEGRTPRATTARMPTVDHHSTRGASAMSAPTVSETLPPAITNSSSENVGTITLRPEHGNGNTVSHPSKSIVLSIAMATTSLLALLVLGVVITKHYRRRGGQTLRATKPTSDLSTMPGADSRANAVNSLYEGASEAGNRTETPPPVEAIYSELSGRNKSQEVQAADRTYNSLFELENPTRSDIRHQRDASDDFITMTCDYSTLGDR